MASYVWDVYSVDMYYMQRYREEAWHVSGISASNPAFMSARFIFNVLSGLYRLSGYKQYSAGDHPTMIYVNVGTYQQNTMYYCESGVYGTGTDIYPKDPSKAGVYTSELEPFAGDLIATASSQSAEAYPQNGTTDNTSWYILRGAPDRISYPEFVQPGKEIRITWSEGINPESYRLERSADGGTSWTTLSSELEDTEYIDTSAALLAAGTSLMYRICTIGESVVSEYTTGGVLTISQSAVSVKIGGQWKEAAAMFTKIGGVWHRSVYGSEGDIITDMHKYKVVHEQTEGVV